MEDTKPAGVAAAAAAVVVAVVVVVVVRLTEDRGRVKLILILAKKSLTEAIFRSSKLATLKTEAA